MLSTFFKGNEEQSGTNKTETVQRKSIFDKQKNYTKQHQQTEIKTNKEQIKKQTQLKCNRANILTIELTVVSFHVN